MTMNDELGGCNRSKGPIIKYNSRNWGKLQQNLLDSESLDQDSNMWYFGHAWVLLTTPISQLYWILCKFDVLHRTHNSGSYFWIVGYISWYAAWYNSIPFPLIWKHNTITVQCHSVHHKSHIECHGTEPYALKWEDKTILSVAHGTELPSSKTLCGSANI